MTEVEISIPVVKVVFSVEVLRRSVLLPLDVALLRSIGDGICSTKELSDKYQLSWRIIRASVVRLLEEDLLSVNLASERLALSPRALAAHRSHELTSLSYLGEPRRECFSAMQELCWGTVITGWGNVNGFRLGAPGREATCLAGEPPERSLLSLRSPEIASLYNARFSNRSQGDAELLAVSGRLADRPGSTNINLVLTAIKVGGVLDLWPIEASALWHRSDIAGFLAQMRRRCRDLPELSGVYAEAGTKPSRKAVAVQGGIVRATDMASKSQLEFLSGSLDEPGVEADEQTIRELFEDCKRILGASCQLSPVVDSEHVTACKTMIEQAGSFCVIHSAFWSDAGIRQYETEIRQALSRGVSVFLLRGLGELGVQDTSSPPVLAELEVFARETPGTLMFSTAPHHSHAKLVISDTNRAIVSSFNFLGATAANPQFNVGLKCYSDTRGPLQLPLCLLDNLAANGLTAEPLERLSEVLQAIRLSMPMGSDRSDGSERMSLEAILTPEEWYQQALGKLEQQQLSPWELVTNAEHRDIMLRALHTARRSVVITSGDLTESAADRVFLDYLAAATRRDVGVTVLWGNQDTDDEQQRSSLQAVAAIRTARGGAPDRIRISEQPSPVHAKLLIVDDEVCLVSSFNFLSYRGTKSGAHEIGIKVYNRQLSAALHALVDGRLVIR